MGLVMEGAVQQAPQSGLHCMGGSVEASAKAHGLDIASPPL
jgi:hypothetical protein